MRHLGRRLLHSLFLLLGVSVLSFVFVELAPAVRQHYVVSAYLWILLPGLVMIPLFLLTFG